MTLMDPKPGFQGHGIFEVEYRKTDIGFDGGGGRGGGGGGGGGDVIVIVVVTLVSG